MAKQEWASTFAVLFVLAMIGLILANKYVADFPLGTKTFVFIAILGIGFFVGIRLLGLSTAAKQLQFEDLAIMGGVIYAIYWILTKYDFAPNFTVVAMNIKSMIGL